MSHTVPAASPAARSRASGVFVDDAKVLRRPWQVALVALVGWAVIAGHWGAVALYSILTVSIALHELAHLLVARRRGVRVSKFFVGLGPRICQTRIGGCEVSLRLVPIAGGAIEIDPADEENLSHADWVKVAVAGPAANLVASVAMFAGVALAVGMSPVDAFVHGWEQVATLIVLIVETVGRFPSMLWANLTAGFAGSAVPETTERIMSPVAMGHIGNDAMRVGGMLLVVQIGAAINASLGFLNLLPIAPLDGSLIAKHCFEAAASRVTGRPVTISDRAFKAVAYGFTGMMIVLVVSACLVDLRSPLDVFA